MKGEPSLFNSRGKETMFPLDFYDISLWLAITTIILLTTSELISARYGQVGLIVEKERLRTTAIILEALFLFTVALRIFQIIITM